MHCCLYSFYTVYDMSGSVVGRRHKDKRNSWEMPARISRGQGVLGRIGNKNKGKCQQGTSAQRQSFMKTEK